MMQYNRLEALKETCKTARVGELVLMEDYLLDMVMVVRQELMRRGL